jgi:hypothetical protein
LALCAPTPRFGCGLIRGDADDALFCNRVERSAIAEKGRLRTRKRLPAADRDIDVKRAQLDRETDPANRRVMVNFIQILFAIERMLEFDRGASSKPAGPSI